VLRQLHESPPSERRRSSSAEPLPPGLLTLLLERYGDGFGLGADGLATPRSRKQAGKFAPVHQAGGAGVSSGAGGSGGDVRGEASATSFVASQLGQLPNASLSFDPIWVDEAGAIRALHGQLQDLAHEVQQRGGQRLRVGIDTEWTNGEDSSDSSGSLGLPTSSVMDGALGPEDEHEGAIDERRAGRSRPPRVALVQLAVAPSKAWVGKPDEPDEPDASKAWVLDALPASCAAALGPLLRWLLESEALLLLGFAFRGDLRVLQPLLGPAPLAVRSLVDLQTLGRRRGEDTPSLRKVCARSLGVHLDKAQQCSDWSRRPLEPVQLLYAAIDAHILLELHEALTAAPPAADCTSAGKEARAEVQVGAGGGGGGGGGGSATASLVDNCGMCVEPEVM